MSGQTSAQALSAGNNRSKICKMCVKKKYYKKVRADPARYELDKARDRARGIRKRRNNLLAYRLNAKRKRLALRLKILDAYGGRMCSICGENDINVLVLDHVHNNGAQERKTKHGHPGRFHKHLIKNGFPQGYQVLCCNCNWAKRVMGGKSPEYRRRVVQFSPAE